MPGCNLCPKCRVEEAVKAANSASRVSNAEELIGVANREIRRQEKLAERYGKMAQGNPYVATTSSPSRKRKRRRSQSTPKKRVSSASRPISVERALELSEQHADLAKEWESVKDRIMSTNDIHEEMPSEEQPSPPKQSKVRRMSGAALGALKNNAGKIAGTALTGAALYGAWSNKEKIQNALAEMKLPTRRASSGGASIGGASSGDTDSSVTDSTSNA